MESKCFYCPNDKVSLDRVVSYIVAGGKTYPVCATCDEVIGALDTEEYVD